MASTGGSRPAWVLQYGLDATHSSVLQETGMAGGTGRTAKEEWLETAIAAFPAFVT